MLKIQLKRIFLTSQARSLYANILDPLGFSQDEVVHTVRMLHAAFHGFIEVEKAGLFTLPFRIGLRAFWRQMTLLSKIEKIHKYNMPERHWYLELLGVEPSEQGQGIGSVLMQPILQQADLEGIPCYLETFSEKNTFFYNKHGFQLLRTVALPEVYLRVWTMKREPQ